MDGLLMLLNDQTIESFDLQTMINKLYDKQNYSSLLCYTTLWKS